MDKREHILNTMQELFKEGTAGTASVSDIARRAGIAKGGLYYYFHSKEEVLDALIERQYSSIITHCNEVVSSSTKNALGKFELLFKTYNTSYIDPSIDDYLHMPTNAAIHQKSLTTIVTSLTPILSSILTQGVSEGLFTCTYPDEYAQCFLSYLTFLLDPGLFTWSKDVLIQKIKAIADIMENMLCTEKGSFSFLYDIHNKALKSN